MEPKLITVNHEDFIVHFKRESEMNWSGTATQIQKYTDGTWTYQSNTSSDSTDKFEDARVWFEWLFCWRGVWEGRIYFKDEEYWCEEMETMPLIWNEIESIMKEKIKSDNSDYHYFDN